MCVSSDSTCLTARSQVTRVCPAAPAVVKTCFAKSVLLYASIRAISHLLEGEVTGLCGLRGRLQLLVLQLQLRVLLLQLALRGVGVPAVLQGGTQPRQTQRHCQEPAEHRQAAARC